MARIRYVAFLADEPERLGHFYRDFLGMDEIGRSAEGDVSLTDGFCNFTFLRRRPELGEPRMETGLHHLGLEVDSIAAVRERYAELMPGWQSKEEPGGPHYGEYRIYDPEATPLSLSERGFGVPGEARRVPRLAHVALNSVNTDGMLDFYTGMFGFRVLKTTELRRKQGRGNRFAGDGFTNLAIHPFQSTRPGHEPRFGVNHIGFLVHDMEARLAAFSHLSRSTSQPLVIDRSKPFSSGSRSRYSA